tara:strand:+ start:530 stop:799 length:270 start_codon:yes stop_codon:yes gene_type:complete
VKKAVNGKFGIWLSTLEINLLKQSLRWYDNSAHWFNSSNHGSTARMLIDDLNKIQRVGPQIKEKENKIDKECDIIYEDDIMNNICKECE